MQEVVSSQSSITHNDELPMFEGKELILSSLAFSRNVFPLKMFQE